MDFRMRRAVILTARLTMAPGPLWRAMLLTLVACATASLAVKSFSELGLLGVTEQATLPPNVDPGERAQQNRARHTEQTPMSATFEGGAALT
jgi:hypothetical protein